MVNTATRSASIKLRVTPDQKQRLDEASRLENTTLTGFVLEDALTRADRLLADQTRFVLTESQFSEYLAILERPVRDTPRLRRLLSEPSIFDR
jgi:uncharacterized protein (DUF1778 family)